MKINVNNAKKLQLALDNAQQNQRARLVTTEDIKEQIGIIEGRLSDLMHKKDWVDLTFCVDCNAQEFPNSYRGTPMSTHVVLRRFKSGWFVISIIRWATNRKNIEPANISNPQYARAMAEYVSKNF